VTKKPNIELERLFQPINSVKGVHWKHNMYCSIIHRKPTFYTTAAHQPPLSINIIWLDVKKGLW